MLVMFTKDVVIKFTLRIRIKNQVIEQNRTELWSAFDELGQGGDQAETTFYVFLHRSH